MYGMDFLASRQVRNCSRQLYDTLRKFSQDNAKNVKQTGEELLERGLLTRDLYERLKDGNDPEGGKMLDLTSELLRQELLSQARQAGERSQSGIEDLKRGVERAAESVLGDDTEALRLAQQELDKLMDELQREMARAQGNSSATNQAQGSQRASGQRPGGRWA